MYIYKQTKYNSDTSLCMYTRVVDDRLRIRLNQASDSEKKQLKSKFWLTFINLALWLS